MTKLILAVVFLLALSGSVLASPATVNVNATQDTTVMLQNIVGTINLGNCTAIAINTTYNYGACTNVLIHLPNGGGDLNSRNIFQFNTSPINNRVVTSMKLVFPSATAGALHTRTLVYNSNKTWDEMTLTGDSYASAGLDSSATNQLQTINFGGSTATSTEFIDLTNGSYQMIGDVYTGIMTVQVSNPTPCTGSCQPQQVQVGASEGANSPYLLTTVDDVVTAQILSSGNVNTFFDFESNRVSTTLFTGADFQYNVATNTLTPIAPAQLIGSDSTTTNTLLQKNCEVGFSTSQFLNTNVPAGTYSIYCFDLSSQHGGRGFKGMIKVTANNVSGSIFNFHWAMFDPSYTTFSNIAISPAVAVEGLNLTVSWQTTNPITSILRYRYFDTNTFSWTPFGGVTNDTLTTSHSLIIPASSMFETEYIIDLSGLDASNVSFFAPPYSFNATSSIGTLAVQGLGVFTFNEFGFPTPAGISLDNGLAQTTQQFENTQGETVYGFAFPKSVATIGNHNITAKDYASSTRAGATVVNIQSYPTFVTMTLRPHHACVPASFHAQQAFCNQTMGSTNFSSVGATGKFCKYTPDECNQFNFTTGSCLVTAGQRSPAIPWVLYLCYDDFNPTGRVISPDGALGYVVPLGQQIEGQGGGAINPASEPLGLALGTDSEGAKFFIAMLLTMIVTIGIGLYVKDVGVTGITFIGLMGMFTLIGWLPWWFLLIEVVVTIFLIARFFRQTMTPQ